MGRGDGQGDRTDATRNGTAAAADGGFWPGAALAASRRSVAREPWRGARAFGLCAHGADLACGGGALPRGAARRDGGSRLLRAQRAAGPALVGADRQYDLGGAGACGALAHARRSLATGARRGWRDCRDDAQPVAAPAGRRGGALDRVGPRGGAWRRAALCVDAHRAYYRDPGAGRGDVSSLFGPGLPVPPATATGERAGGGAAPAGPWH